MAATPTIFDCCERNDVEGLKKLIRSKGTKIINEKNEYGSTPLHIAAGYNSMDCLKLLLDAGAEIKLKNNKGNTSLHYAASNNSKECLELLLEAGVKINAKNHYGNTSLHFAACYNSKECLQLLLEAGAEPNVRNGYGECFLDLIRYRTLRKEMEEYIQELATLDIKEPDC